VVVDAGRHEVTLVYRPAGLYPGTALAMIGIAICVFLRFSRHGQWQT